MTAFGSALRPSLVDLQHVVVASSAILGVFAVCWLFATSLGWVMDRLVARALRDPRDAANRREWNAIISPRGRS